MENGKNRLNFINISHINKLNLMKAIKHFKLFILCCTWFGLNAQTQIGADFTAKSDAESLGYSVSMPDAETVAIGAPNSNNEGEIHGAVGVYTWDGETWTQKGTDIKGLKSGDHLGFAVTMPDANTVVIGDVFNAAQGRLSGLVRCFIWDGTSWIQKGSDLGPVDRLYYLKEGICAPDANTVAFKSIPEDPTNDLNEYIKVLHWDGAEWASRGEPLVNPDFSINFGNNLTMPDDNTLAFTSYNRQVNSSQQAKVHIYQWNGAAWTQKGEVINTYKYSTKFSALSMPDAQTLAIGTPFQYGDYVYKPGMVQIFSWDGNKWNQKGTNVNCPPVQYEGGFAFKLMDANTLIIGTPMGNLSGDLTGVLQLYRWDGQNWIQKGMNLPMPCSFNSDKIKVSMPDQDVIAIGAPKYNEEGIVRVYSVGLSTATAHPEQGSIAAVAYPNPADGMLTIDLGTEYNNINVTIQNLMGQKIYATNIHGKSQQLRLPLPDMPGVYLIQVSTAQKQALLRVVRR